jgi:hypothetical protein
MEPLTMYLEYTLGYEQDAPTEVVIEFVVACGFRGCVVELDRALQHRVSRKYSSTVRRQDQCFWAVLLYQPIHNATLGEIHAFGNVQVHENAIRAYGVSPGLANRPIFKVGTSNADSKQTTLALQLIYTY